MVTRGVLVRWIARVARQCAPAWRCASGRSSVRPVPAQRLPGDPGDGGEVPVVMEQCQAEQFRGRRDDKVYRPGAAVLAQGGEIALHLPGAGVSAVVDRYPAEGGPQIPDRVFSVLG